MGSTKSTRMAMALISIGVVLALYFNGANGALVKSSGTTFGPGRNLLQTGNISEPLSKSDDTVRVDPLDNFRKYRGGYDITNKHYWSSTVFSGVYGYVIGVVWLLCGIVFGGFLLATTFCCRHRNRKLKKKRSHCHKNCYLWPILLASFFTLLAITATGLVLGGNSKFHSRAKTVVDIIIDTADEASETIFNTTGAMKGISTNLAASNQSAQATAFLSTSQQLDTQATDIHRHAAKNRRAIDKGLQIVYIITTVIISLNLVAMIALSVSGILRLRRALHLLIILCWVLTVLCWLFFGIYLFIERFAGDTCTAMEEFQRDPKNSSLSSILPCDELVSARSALSDVGAGIYDLVNEVNANITIVQICNPFSAPPEYQYQPENCPANTIRIGDIPEALRLISCIDTNNGTCNGGILISSSDFNAVEGYSTSVQNLLNAYPGMESLVECQTVKDAFSEILHKHCRPLKRYATMVWAAMVFLSVVMVALLLIWTIEALHDHKHHFSDGSVKPHFATENTVELEKGRATDDDNDAKPNSVL